MKPVSIAELWLYPVKSLGGVRLESATLTQSGLLGDREWMIVDARGAFVSQRKLPGLAAIRASYPPTGLLRLVDGQQNSIEVPIPQTETQTVRIWNDQCLGRAAPTDVNQWLTHAANSPTPLTLVYFAKQFPRVPNQQRFGSATTHFADAAPFLVANKSSLQALNECLRTHSQQPVDIRRFRPNIVIEGLSPFMEHQCKNLYSSTMPIEIKLVDHCQRCSVITVDQTTGAVSHNSSLLKQLAQINGMPAKPQAPAFGVNSVLTCGEGLEIHQEDCFIVA